MSKSIKQYKQAMDNIKISDSFMKRTETMLKEMPQQEENISLTAHPKWSVKRISVTAGFSLAACIVAVFSIRAGLMNNTITTTTIEETYITTEITVEAAEEEVLVEIEDTDDAFDGLDMGILPDTSLSEDDDDKPATSQQKDPSVADPQPNENIKPTANAETVSENAADNLTDTTSSQEELPEVKLLYDIDFENATVDVRSYIDGHGNKSISLNTNEAQNAVTNIANKIYNTKLTSENTNFTSEFVVIITDKTTGEEAFTVYLTDKQSVVVTAHLKTGQVRTTYLLSKTDYEEIEEMLFLNFGTDNDYDAFCALKSGK